MIKFQYLFLLLNYGKPNQGPPHDGILDLNLPSRDMDNTMNNIFKNLAQSKPNIMDHFHNTFEIPLTLAYHRGNFSL